MIDERVLYPVYENGEFVLKSVRDSVNSDRTKKNHIFEFKGEKTGRLILSDSLKGYGPYLPKPLEENLEMLEENVDCCFFSGFHNASGYMQAKIRKAKRQISRIEKPVHLEYVHDPDTSKLVVEHLIPVVDSLGLDETELKLLCEMENVDCPDKPNFGEAFVALKQLLEKLELERAHLHTYRYHIAVEKQPFGASLRKLRDSMLYGEVCAIQSADRGMVPDSEDIQDFDMDGKHLHGMEQLEDFGEFHGLDNFASKGTAEVDNLKVAGIPVIIHEDPERTVGMGDLISSGAFSSEISLQDS
jgi:ADP-dependent phosphofructokinase/glucokinase